MNPEPAGPDVLGVWTLIITPILSFAAVLFGSFVAARSDSRLNSWRQHDERFRILCWAVDLRNSSDQQTREDGEIALEALRNYKLLQEEDADLVCWIANRLPTNDHWQQPYADQVAQAAESAVAAEDPKLDAREANNEHDRT